MFCLFGSALNEWNVTRTKPSVYFNVNKYHCSPVRVSVCLSISLPSTPPWPSVSSSPVSLYVSSRLYLFLCVCLSFLVFPSCPLLYIYIYNLHFPASPSLLSPPFSYRCITNDVFVGFPPSPVAFLPSPLLFPRPQSPLSV